MKQQTIGDIDRLVTQNESAFAYLSAEIFRHRNHLQNHSVNVCAIGTAILKRFNDHFSRIVNDSLVRLSSHPMQEDEAMSSTLPATKTNPLDLGDADGSNPALQVDRRSPLRSPVEVYDRLPEYLRDTIPAAA